MRRLDHREGDLWKWQMARLGGSIIIKDGSWTFGFDAWVVRRGGHLIRRGQRRVEAERDLGTEALLNTRIGDIS